MNKEQEFLLAEVIVKVAAIERLLTKSGVILADDLTNEMKKISDEVITFIKANSEQFFGDKDKN